MGKNENDFNKYKVASEIGNWVKRVVVSFIICSFVVMLSSKLIDHFKLPERLVFLVFLPCGVFYLYQIYSFTRIRCGNCGNTVFPNVFTFPIDLFTRKQCPNCGAKIR